MTGEREKLGRIKVLRENSGQPRTFYPGKSHIKNHGENNNIIQKNLNPVGSASLGNLN